MQRRGVDHGGDAGHLAPDEAGIDDRAEFVSEGRWLPIDPARGRTGRPEGPDDRLAEVTRAAGDQNRHEGPQPAASSVENHDLVWKGWMLWEKLERAKHPKVRAAQTNSTMESII